MPKIHTLHELYVDALRDLYNAENQILKALPRMMKAVTSEELRTAFQEHLDQTEGQIDRLEQCFDSLGMKVRGKKCLAMEGLVDEGKELMSMDIDDNALDAGLIGAAQKIEHYEIASYGTVRTWAQELGLSDQAALLEATLNEEKETDERLTELAEAIINIKAEQGDSGADNYSMDGASRNGRRH